MKKLFGILWLLLFLIVGTGIYDYVSSQTKAFEAYQEQARTIVVKRRHKPPFEKIEGRIANINYILISIEHEDRGRLRLTTEQTVIFQKGNRLANWEGRKFAKTRHDVLMTRTDGLWEISKIQEGTTTISNSETVF